MRSRWSQRNLGCSVAGRGSTRWRTYWPNWRRRWQPHTTENWSSPRRAPTSSLGEPHGIENIRGRWCSMQHVEYVGWNSTNCSSEVENARQDSPSEGLVLVLCFPDCFSTFFSSSVTLCLEMVVRWRDVCNICVLNLKPNRLFGLLSPCCFARYRKTECCIASELNWFGRLARKGFSSRPDGRLETELAGPCALLHDPAIFGRAMRIYPTLFSQPMGPVVPTEVENWKAQLIPLFSLEKFIQISLNLRENTDAFFIYIIKRSSPRAM